MGKKVISMLLCLALTAGVIGISVSATEWEASGGVITTRYMYLDTILPTLTISGGKAAAKGVMTGYSSVSRIEHTVYLQEKNGSTWSSVESWSGSDTGTRTTYRFSSGKVVAGKTYRTKTVAKVYSGSKSETVTAYSEEKKAKS